MVKLIPVLALSLGMSASQLLPNQMLMAKNSSHSTSQKTCTTIKAGKSYWFEYQNQAHQTMSTQAQTASTDMKLCHTN